MKRNRRNDYPWERPDKTILGRTLLLMVVCGIVAFAVLVGRLYIVQIRDHEYYEMLALEQQTRETDVTAARGTITDKNGDVLAVSATAYSVYICPYEAARYEEDVNLIAEKLEEILGTSRDTVIEKASDRTSWYKTIATKIDPELANEVRAMKSTYDIRSVHVETDSKRFYPNGTLACHILGFTGMDGYGLDGIEALYNDYLTGTDGSVGRLKSGDGTSIPYMDYESFDAGISGSTVQLTLDSNVQYIAEKYLEQGIRDYDVQNGGCCIVMDVNTGAILAMASRESYDPNQYLLLSERLQEKLPADTEEAKTYTEQARLKQWRNKAVSDTYEPGSVFKIITMSIGLEEELITKSSSYNCGGSMAVPGRTKRLKCWKTAGHGPQNLTEAAQHSCNVAFVNIGLKIGAKTFYSYIDRFGLFDKTGVDLLGEAGSQWWDEEIFCSETNLSQLAAASFGQTFNITPLQMITAVSAACNGGKLMQPYVVEKIVDSEENVVYHKEPSVVSQVLSERTSDTVCEILEQVVGGSEGTGKNAYVAGYRIGGKTGTSEKVAQDAAGGAKEYMVSFCGIAPIYDPQIAVLLILDTPSNETGIYISGGVMAAPLVGNIFSEILPYLGYEPQYTEEEKAALDVTIPNVIGLRSAEAKRRIENLGLEVSVQGDGDTIIGQLPEGGSVVTAGSRIVLYTEEIEKENVIVPDVSGMNLETAREALEAFGLYMCTNGISPANEEATVVFQSAVPGKSLPMGTSIRVTLYDSGDREAY